MKITLKHSYDGLIRAEVLERTFLIHAIESYTPTGELRTLSGATYNLIKGEVEKLIELLDDKKADKD